MYKNALFLWDKCWNAYGWRIVMSATNFQMFQSRERIDSFNISRKCGKMLTTGDYHWRRHVFTICAIFCWTENLPNQKCGGKKSWTLFRRFVDSTIGEVIPNYSMYVTGWGKWVKILTTVAAGTLYHVILFVCFITFIISKTFILFMYLLVCLMLAPTQ